MTEHRAIYACFANVILDRPIPDPAPQLRMGLTTDEAIADMLNTARETCDVEIDRKEPTWHRCRWGHDIVFYPVGPSRA